MNTAANRPIVPQPFLGPLFEPGVEPVIATGFNYHAEEIALHGVKIHNAIDMNLPRGTKILAPADGYYIATYGEVLLRNEDGSPRILSARAARAAGQDINPPTPDGEWPVYFGSFVVQGWHGRGRYTQYAHLDWVNSAIPYYPPVEVKDAEGRPSGDRRHSPMLRATVAEYRKPGVAAFLKAGEVIAEVGMTGCGWDKPCYDFARLDADGRPDFRGVNYPYYTTPHLHFAVFGRRAPRGRNATAAFDPFGIYGTFSDGYPARRADWSRATPNARHSPLWLGITIRPLLTNDLTDIELILREWIRHTDTREIVEDEVVAVLDNMRLSADDSTKRHYLVAAVGGRVVGVMGLYVPEAGETIDFATTDKPFEIINAYVADDQRGNGVGQALADSVEELGRRLGRTELVVMSGSRNRLTGFGFWDKRYGERVGFEPDHYGPGRERVAWHKSL